MADFTEGKCPNYEVVPLRSDTIGVVACQFNPNRDIDVNNPQKVKKENLDKMLFMCDMARFRAGQAAMGPPTLDLVVFPEFSITGIKPDWTREDWQKVAIELPGEETEILGKKARELNCYIAFASHTKDPKNWPGHNFNTSIIIDPRGEVIHKHWKAYRVTGGSGEWATTAHDVLDKFVEMYGWDAVWPVARTDIGNLATYVCSEGFAPETARAFTFKGAEILCRCIGGGGELNSGKYRLQFRADCSFSLVYGVYTNGGNGGSMIVNPLGQVMNEILDNNERVVCARIPIAQYRSEHSRPHIRTEIYIPVMEQYQGQFPPNMYSDYGVPLDMNEARKLCLEHARFWSYPTANR